MNSFNHAKQFVSKHAKSIAAGAVCVAPLMAQAAVDVTAITSTLTDVGLVGAALFGVAVAIYATKIVRRAL